MERLVQLTEITADKNKKDFIPSLDAVAKGLSKGNVDRLRAIGLQTDNALLLDKEAKLRGVSTEQLDLATKQQIAYNEILRALEEQAAAAGKSQDGLAFSFVRYKNEVIDNSDTILRSVNNISASFFELGQSAETSERKTSSFFDTLIDGATRYQGLGTPLENIANILEDTADSIDKSVKTIKGEANQFDNLASLINESTAARIAENTQRKTTNAR